MRFWCVAKKSISLPSYVAKIENIEAADSSRRNRSNNNNNVKIQKQTAYTNHDSALLWLGRLKFMWFWSVVGTGADIVNVNCPTIRMNLWCNCESWKDW
jgi:hypothetical protein